MTYSRTFDYGDHVYIARPNKKAKLPDKQCVYAGDFPIDWIGREFTLNTDEHEYDGLDNSWEIDDEWVHEGALEYVTPLTQEDEDAAIASILRAAGP